MTAARVHATLTTVLLMLTTPAAAARTRLTQARAAHRDDTGLGTLELVVITLGLFLIAAIAVGVITGAIQSRLAQIS